MEAHHITAGARAGLALVRDEADRFDLVDGLADALGALLLAYCVMDTHLHVVAEGPADHAVRWLEGALTRYTRAHNAHHGIDGRLLRGRPEPHAIQDEEQLWRAIRYVHDNPLHPRSPLAERAIDFRWSSQRAFAGLSLARAANVERALALAGPFAWRLRGPCPPLADLAPSPAPTASPEVLAAAAAEVYGLRPWALVSDQRSDALAGARALFLRVGQLESLTVCQLAAFLNRSRSQAHRILVAAPVPDVAARLARTLLREPAMRRQLPWLHRVPDATDVSHPTPSRA